MCLTMFLLSIKVSLMAASTGLMILIVANTLVCAGLATRHVVLNSKRARRDSPSLKNDLKG